jgi:hypothetical protein
MNQIMIEFFSTDEIGQVQGNEIMSMWCRYYRLCLARLGIFARFRSCHFLIWRKAPPSKIRLTGRQQELLATDSGLGCHVMPSKHEKQLHARTEHLLETPLSHCATVWGTERRYCDQHQHVAKTRQCIVETCKLSLLLHQQVCCNTTQRLGRMTLV